MAFCVAGLTGAGPAHADTWAVLATGAGDTASRAHRSVAAVADALAQEEGATVISPSDAVRLFEERHSTEARVMATTDVSEVQRRTQAAARHLAIGELRAARREYEALRELSHRLAERVAAEESDARDLLNGCLVMVRYLLAAGRDEPARAQALECRRRSPTVDPDADFHPPDVRRLYDEVVAELQALPPASLRITAVDGGPCRVHMNGVEVGSTPWRIARVVTGDLAVRLHCPGDRGQGGRVHRLRLTPGENHLEVHVAFEQAVRTAGAITLEYADEATHAQSRVPHAAVLGQVLGATNVVLISAFGERREGRARLDLVRGGVVVASALLDPLGAGYRWGEVAEAAAMALAAGRSVDLTGETAAPMAAWQPPAAPTIGGGGDGHGDEGAGSGGGSGGGLAAAGWILGGVGVAGLGTGWGFYSYSRGRLTRLSQALPMDPDYQTRQDELDQAQLVTQLSAGLGSMALTASLPFLLPEADGVPWWAWASGGAGALVGALGAWQLAADGPCDGAKPNCTANLGGLLLWHALPMLAVPIVYLLRGPPAAAPRGDPPADSDAAVSIAPWLQLTTAEAHLGLTGAW